MGAGGSTLYQSNRSSLHFCDPRYFLLTVDVWTDIQELASPLTRRHHTYDGGSFPINTFNYHTMLVKLCRLISAWQFFLIYALLLDQKYVSPWREATRRTGVIPKLTTKNFMIKKLLHNRCYILDKEPYLLKQTKQKKTKIPSITNNHYWMVPA